MLTRILATTAIALALAVPAMAQQQSQQQTDQPDQLEGRAPTTTTRFPDQSPQAVEQQAQQQEQQAEQQEQRAEQTQERAEQRQEQAQDRQEQAQDGDMPTDQLALAQADQIKGSAVRNQQGEEIGSIEDVVLDVKKGDVAFAVVGVGGFLGVGEKNVAVPWDRLQPGNQPQSFVMNVDRQTLENAPTIDLEQVAKMQEPQVRDQVSSFWDKQPQKQ